MKRKARLGSTVWLSMDVALGRSLGRMSTVRVYNVNRHCGCGAVVLGTLVILPSQKDLTVNLAPVGWQVASFFVYGCSQTSS